MLKYIFSIHMTQIFRQAISVVKYIFYICMYMTKCNNLKDQMNQEFLVGMKFTKIYIFLGLHQTFKL